MWETSVRKRDRKGQKVQKWQRRTLDQVSPTSGSWTSISCQICSSIILEIKCTINIIHLNYPETHPFPPSVHEKLSSMKSVPGAKNVGDHCLRPFTARHGGRFPSASTNTLVVSKQEFYSPSWSTKEQLLIKMRAVRTWRPYELEEILFMNRLLRSLKHNEYAYSNWVYKLGDDIETNRKHVMMLDASIKDKHFERRIRALIFLSQAA